MTGQIRFDDGAGYERFMGAWSRLAGEAFLAWLAPEPGWRWLDVGCGNGAFTELVFERTAPRSVHGIDPSEGQLAFARARPKAREADFKNADAMALPFPDGAFDAAVLPLVIFFVPEPPKGVAEAARVVRPGGAVAAYAWDMDGGGFPYGPLVAAMEELGMKVPKAPNPGASATGALKALWAGAGLGAVETREIAVRRTFADFDDYWDTVLGGPSVGPGLAALNPQETARLQALMRARLPADDAGRITLHARANAVKGYKASKFGRF